MAPPVVLPGGGGGGVQGAVEVETCPGAQIGGWSAAGDDTGRVTTKESATKILRSRAIEIIPPIWASLYFADPFSTTTHVGFPLIEQEVGRALPPE